MKNSKSSAMASSAATSTLPQPLHRPRQPSSPPVYSPALSPASSDHSSLSFFSPRGGFDDEEPHHFHHHHHHFRSSPMMTASKSIREEEHESGSETSSHSPALSPIVIATKSVREQPVMMTKVELGLEEETISTVAVESGGQKSSNYHYSYGEDNDFADNNENKRTKETSAAGGYRRSRGVEFFLRLVGMMTCMISFSVMAADKHRGWALDSYDRYKEFSYCMWMNVMGFAYSGAQAVDLLFNFSSDNYSDQHLLRYYLNFFTDQVLAYLLVSASSSAATRIEDWEWNWGKDKFTQMATASVALSFLAFMALALSSLLSGYNLCSSKFL